MEANLVPVEVKAILPAKTGVAVFIGDDEKVFLIYVDHSVGAAITMFLQGVKKERPLTHDLIRRIFRSLGIAQSAIARRIAPRFSLESLHEKVVLPREDRVQEGKANRPVIWKPGHLLTKPFRAHETIARTFPAGL